MPPIYIDNLTGGAQAIAGLKGLFSYKLGISAYRRRRSSQVLHLGKAKPDMVTLVAKFQAAMNGTTCQPGEFAYINPEQTLRLKNLDTCSGITIDTEGSYAIQMQFIPRERVTLSTIHQAPVPLA